jgi:hypothetical protein
MLSDCKGTIKQAQNKRFYPFFAKQKVLSPVFLAKIRKISEKKEFFWKK